MPGREQKPIFQFKITLVGSTPPIWRRILVQDCTLDRLHECIQTSMGWTNTHLHVFEIKRRQYGDPELLEDFECIDSATILLSEVLPKSRFKFGYTYDFGDDWVHEVVFEGRVPQEQGKEYPICLEGERARPPEDCGGIWGFKRFLLAIADPAHEDHESLLEWCGGSFSPEEFDPAEATLRMQQGLPDWQT